MSDEIESSIWRLCDARAYDVAATRAIETYGPEIRRFIAGRVRNEADARDIFSVFCEDLWQGLPGFAWRCTLRGWVYTLARHSELRYAASPIRQPERLASLADLHPCNHTRTRTPAYARTEVKDRFREIRARLGEEDQLILVLRVDRDLEWKDIAHILAGPEAAPSVPELQRRGARIRKRFQLIKARLRQWAVDDGLLPATDAS